MVTLRTRLLRGTLITTQPPVVRRAVERSGDWTRYEQRNGPYVTSWWQHPDGRRDAAHPDMRRWEAATPDQIMDDLQVLGRALAALS